MWLSGEVIAQDIHLSQFYRSPLLLNPANTGQFDGEFRVVGNHKSQWNSFTNGYTTTIASADFKNVFPNLSFGAHIYTDVAGDGRMGTVEIMPSAAYSMKLDQDSSLLLSVGAQVGMRRYQLDFSALYFDDQYRNGQFDPNNGTQAGIASESFGFANLNLGVRLQKKWNVSHQTVFGVTTANLSKPDIRWTDFNVELNRRLSTFATHSYRIDQEWSLEPAMLFQLQGNQTEYSLGLNAVYLIQGSVYGDQSIDFGLWRRSSDAWVAYMGFKYYDWQVGVSYDINNSSLTQSSAGRGGLEFSIIYIRQAKPAQRKRFLTCPDYL